MSDNAKIINDTYKVMKKLGKGAQGAVWLVLHMQENRNYVLKKVECNDEGEATKAFQEAMALQNLKHRYICGYKEFFVNWDSDDETMYVCIVMDCYETGDLETVLKNQRTKETALPEPILKKWFGQIVEALHFVHESHVIHRDLKPSNIFMTAELDVAVGDFGVATVMNDAKLRTRTTVGTMAWMAPEVMEKPYDDRSDVWSLGCIVLDAATCAFLDTNQSRQALLELKQTGSSGQDKLIELLRGVDASYSKDLSMVITQMLRTDFKHRPNIAALIQLPFVRSCLSLCKSPLVDTQAHQQSLLTTSKPVTTKKIPDTVPTLLTFLQDHISRVACMVAGLEKMTEFFTGASAETSKIDDAGKKLIVKILLGNKQNTWVQTAGIQALHAISLVCSAKDDVLYTKEFVDPVLTAMQFHSSNDDLQESALRLMISLAEVDTCCVTIAREGGIEQIQTILTKMELASADSMTDGKRTMMATLCLKALYTISMISGTREMEDSVKGGVIRNICYWAKELEKESDIVRFALGALWGFADDDESIAHMVEQDMHTIVFMAFMNFKEDGEIVKHACDVLAALVVDEEIAFSLLELESMDAFTVLHDTMEYWMSDAVKAEDAAEVVASLFLVLAETVEHSDMVEYAIEADFVEIATRARASDAKDAEGNMKVREHSDRFLRTMEDAV